MSNTPSALWKGDNYKFVGKSFEIAYKNLLNKLKSVVSEVDTKSIDYQLTGLGGYGEFAPYDGTNLVTANQKRGFTTIITPGEFNLTVDISRKAARNDILGETKKVGQRLGYAGAMTVYLAVLRMFGNAFNPAAAGGDGKAWAALDHPVASTEGEGRTAKANSSLGSYSNLISDVFSVNAITKAQSMANRFLTPDGLPFLCNFDTVLVSPELESKAKQYFGENAKLTPDKFPDNNYNAANPVADMMYLVVGGGDAGFTENQWAVCDRTLMREVVNIVYNERPTVLNTETDNPLIDRYVGYIDFGVGFGDARQIIFSSGTGA